MLLYKLSSYAAILHLQYLWNPVWIFLEPLISSKKSSVCEENSRRPDLQKPLELESF